MAHSIQPRDAASASGCLSNGCLNTSGDLEAQVIASMSTTDDAENAAVGVIPPVR